MDAELPVFFFREQPLRAKCLASGGWFDISDLCQLFGKLALHDAIAFLEPWGDGRIDLTHERAWVNENGLWSLAR
ncbi:hypothetical protein [Dyella sp. ASV21]|uniref:hypothetical protein n=1 Tax=Dyella sp. ASV21 TaxID=2795114 RepID=UPI0018ED0B32|nr:hypothetical protein [Dyella sp. ASV21]